MLLKIIFLLGLSLQLQIRPTSTLDFSQFYLPQCCYHPHSGIPAAPTELDQIEPFRHDIRARKVDPAQIIKLNNNHNHSTTETEESALTTALLLESNADKREIKNQAGNKNSPREDSIPESSDDGQGSTLPGGERSFSATRLYRYIIPMDKLEKSNVTTTTATTTATRSHLLARNMEETTTSSPPEEDSEDSTTTTMAPMTTIIPTEKTTAKPRSRSSLPTSLSSRLREQGKTRKSFRKELKTEFKLKQLLSSAQIEAELKPGVDETGTAAPKKREVQDEGADKETETETEGENTTPSLESLLSPQNTTMMETESTLKFKRNTMTNAEQRLRRTHLKRLQPQSSQQQQQHSQQPKPLRSQNQNYIDKMMDINHKMPSSWIINLRRALYQSIDSMLYHTQSKSKSNKGKSNSRHSKSKKSNSKSESTSNESSDSDETIQAKSSTNYFNPHRNRPDSTSQEDLNHHNQRFSLLWPQLREANLTLVEPLTRSETMLPENIYLPTGTGPVASGVVVNTVNGIQLRMASELYFQQDNPHPQHLADQGQGDCNCHLIQNGDILMAYWSVSRIVNENGNPSLQYLIYPVPYNVPTPPRIENFNTQVFEPSMGFQDNPHQQQHHHHHHHRRQPKHPHPQPQPHSPQGGYPMQNQNPISHNSNHHHHHHHPQQNQIQTQLGNPSQQQQYEHHEAPPPYLQETPFNHHIQQETDEPLMSFPPNYETVFKNLQQFNQLPPTVGGRPEIESDFRGVVIQTENGYTPEFVELYKQAVANHLVQKDQHEHHQIQQNLNQLTPFQQLQQYILKQQQAQGIIGHPGGPGQGPTQGPGPGPHHHTPPAHIQLFDGLQQADPNPNPNNPNFPKSIQEIISPFAGGPVPPGSVIINPTSLPIIPVSGPPPPQQQFTGLVALDPSNFQHPISVLPAGVHPNQQQQQQHQHPQQPHDKKVNVNNYYTFDHQGPIDAYTGPLQPNHPQQPQQPQLPPQSHEQGYGHGPPIQNYPNNVNFPNPNNINYPRHPHPPNNPNNQHSSFYENDDKHSNHGHHHNPYKPSPHRPTNNGGGGGRYPPNSEEEMRYHRTQQVPIRQRPQSYSRPSSSSSHIGQSHRRFNQDGSYIINF